MNTLRVVKKLILGETWLLPAGLAATLVAAEFVRRAAPHDWAHTGGAFLLIGVVAVLLTSVTRSARRR